MARFPKEPKCVMKGAITPRNKLCMGYVECTLAAHCPPEKPLENIKEWLQWMDTLYEQVDAEIASMKEFHEAWVHDDKPFRRSGTFRRKVRAACNAKYAALNTTPEGEVWPLLSRLNVIRPYTRVNDLFISIETRIIQDWSRTYGQR